MAGSTYPVGKIGQDHNGFGWFSMVRTGTGDRDLNRENIPEDEMTYPDIGN